MKELSLYSFYITMQPYYVSDGVIPLNIADPISRWFYCPIHDL